MRRPLAVLVDGDQLSPDGLPGLITRLEKEWSIEERVCVRNWRSTKDQQQWRSFADEHGFRLIQRDPVATGKNAADIEITVEAMDLFHRGCRAFCLVSGDMDFTPLVQRLKRGSAFVEWVRPDAIAKNDGKTAAPRRSVRPGRRKAAGTAKNAESSKATKRTAPRPTKKVSGKGASGKTPSARQPVRTTGRAKAAGPSTEQLRFSKPVRRAIAAMRRQGHHDHGWVSVNRLGSILARDGHRREDYGFAKSRPMRRVLEDLGFKVMQIETGAYRVTMD